MKNISDTLLVASLMALFFSPTGFVIWTSLVAIALFLSSLCKIQGRDQA